MFYRVLLLFLLVTALPPLLANSDQEGEQGRAIFAERDRLDQGYISQSVDMEMVLISPNGSETQREIVMRQLEGEPEKGDKVLIVFRRPSDLKGTALLTHEELGEKDDAQWLYLPFYKRVKRIASTNRSGRFVGTEFSYEDLTGDKLEDFSYRYLGRDEINGKEMHWIERIPLNPRSEYSRQETWVDIENHQVVRALLFDKKGRHVKTYTASRWERYQDRYWRAHEMTMRHVPSGRLTRLIASGYEFNSGISDRDFARNSFHRVR